MQEFLDAALSFPAVLFGAALIVVVCFWLLVLAGAADHHSFETNLGAGPAGHGGVPAAVPVSLMVAVAWFTGLTGTVLLHRSAATDTARTAIGWGVLAGALVVSWALARILVLRYRRHFPAEPPPSRRDFIGRVCTIRTGSVSSDFGQAEVAAADGSTAIVQVRQLPQPGEAVFTAGSAGLLYAYDDEGEFFWVSPYDVTLDPGPPKPLPRARTRRTR
ncbi:hypothetical protein ACFVXE_15485 [Streptomyces sp. NPDC058231]|uniref:hypothetical protein n=1 Tax=Streptomyces sp. NPDC058231 TaxID=3346392 RepID=UPI0036EE4A5D